MRLRSGNPRVRAPRANPAKKHRGKPARQNVEPSTFAWIEPLADVDPVVLERRVETPVIVEKTVEVEKPIYIERAATPAPRKSSIVEKEVLVEKEVVVEKKVFVDKPLIVEKQVFVERNKPSDVLKPATIAASADVGDKKVKSRKSEKPKAIIIGRGPGLAARLARIAPSPSPVLAGASALLIALVGVALISPSSDNATAQRSNAALMDDPSIETSGVPIEKNDKSITDKATGDKRDPFAAGDYEAPQPTAASGKSKTMAKPSSKAKQAADAKTRASAPAASTVSSYTANLTTYSSYTPWTKTRKASGGWIDFGGEPTVKVIAVGKQSVELFVVTDVEVLESKSRNIEYENPIRQVKVGKGGIVRFADYRNIQGDDVTYTIRYGGSNKVVVKSKN